ncbi:MAG: hypothetical protein MH472_09420 [Bacteroidia bacterium]|nr:hypothetical protein [Bacteroidia bacterium]
MMLRQKLTSIFSVLPALILLNGLLYIAISKAGIGLSIDSINYFSAAKNWVDGLGLVLFDGSTLVNAAPLYSFFMAPAYFFKLDAFVYAACLQFFFLNLNAIAIFLLLRVLIDTKRILWLYIGVLLLNYFSFVQVSVWALSEMGFICLFSWWLYFVLCKPNNLWAPAFLVGALCLQRYLFWYFVPGIIIYWLWSKREVKSLIVQLAFGFVLTSLWFVRNYLLQGTLLGAHQLGEKFGLSAFFENLLQLANGMYALNPLYAGPAFFIISVLFLYFGFRNETGLRREFCFLLLLIASGLLLFVLVQPNLQMSQLPRYLSVLYVFVYLSWILLFERILTKNWLKFSIAGFVLAVSTILLINKALDFKQNGLGIKSTLAFCADFENVALAKHADLPMLSNFPDVVWLKTGKTCGYLPFLNEDYDAFGKRVPAGLYKVIWFKDSSREMLMNDAILNKSADFTPMYNGHWHKIGTLKIDSGY